MSHCLLIAETVSMFLIIFHGLVAPKSMKLGVNEGSVMPIINVISENTNFVATLNGCLHCKDIEKFLSIHSTLHHCVFTADCDKSE